MPDAQIHPTGTVSTPADYVVPDSAELLLKGVYATFDGSAAASSYLPLVRIISDAGSTVIEAVADTTIAAGASADASWFPHLAAAAQASAGVSSAWFFAKREVSQAIPAASSRKIGWTVHETSDSSVFSVTTHTVTDDTVNGLVPGIYVAQMTMTWQLPQTFLRQGFIITDFLGGAGLSNSPVTDSATSVTAANKTYNLGDVKVLIPSAVPGEISVLANNLDSSNRNVTACYFSILYLSNSTFST